MFVFFKQKTAYEMLRSLVGSEMCRRDIFKDFRVYRIPVHSFSGAGQCWNRTVQSEKGLAQRRCIPEKKRTPRLKVSFCGLWVGSVMNRLPAVLPEHLREFHDFQLMRFGPRRNGPGERHGRNVGFGPVGHNIERSVLIPFDDLKERADVRGAGTFLGFTGEHEGIRGREIIPRFHEQPSVGVRAHETPEQLVCRLLLEKKNQQRFDLRQEYG